MFRVRCWNGCLAVLLLPLAVGCGVNGSNWQNMSAWSPIHYRQMVADEQIVASFQQQLEQLETLADGASGMPIDVQRRHVQELVVSVRTESNPLLRAEVVKTLAAFPIVQAEEGLRLAIEDPIVDVRIVACEAWSRRGGVEALRQLIETLNSDTDADVRLAATRGLARFPSSEAIEALATALNDPDPALQYAGAETLKAVSGQDYGYNISAWREFVQGREPSVAAPSVARRYWPWQWF